MKIADVFFELINYLMFVSDQFSPTRDPILRELRRRWRHVIVSLPAAVALCVLGVFLAPDAAPQNVIFQLVIEARLLLAKAAFIGSFILLVTFCICLARLWSFYDAPEVD